MNIDFDTLFRNILPTCTMVYYLIFFCIFLFVCQRFALTFVPVVFHTALVMHALFKAKNLQINSFLIQNVMVIVMTLRFGPRC